MVWHMTGIQIAVGLVLMGRPIGRIVTGLKHRIRSDDPSTGGGDTLVVVVR